MEPPSRREKTAGRCRVGTSGYVYTHWKNIFYPASMPVRDWLQWYSQHFVTVELNNSFYRLPSADAFKAWRRRVPADFIFAVKFSRYGSHMLRLKNPRDTIRRFDTVAKHLRRNLGPVLVQLPPNWNVNCQRLQEFLARIPRGQRWSVEFRDPRWLRSEVYEVLRHYQVALCIHDKIADHPREITADWTYLRFHGAEQDGGNYSGAQLKSYAREITGFSDSGLDVYAYFNNDWHGFAIANARALKNLLGLDSPHPRKWAQQSA